MLAWFLLVWPWASHVVAGQKQLSSQKNCHRSWPPYRSHQWKVLVIKTLKREERRDQTQTPCILVLPHGLVLLLLLLLLLLLVSCCSCCCCCRSWQMGGADLKAPPLMVKPNEAAGWYDDELSSPISSHDRLMSRFKSFSTISSHYYTTLSGHILIIKLLAKQYKEPKKTKTMTSLFFLRGNDAQLLKQKMVGSALKSWSEF